MELTLSTLGHTWLLDLDGTIVVHNGYKLYGEDRFLDGAEAFLKSIPEEDMVIFITSRERKYKEITESFLINHSIRFNYIIYGAPYGERILLNDDKPSGLKMGYAISQIRDKELALSISIDPTI